MSNEQRLSDVLEAAVAWVEPRYTGGYVGEREEGQAEVCLLGSLACYGPHWSPRDLYTHYTTAYVEPDDQVNFHPDDLRDIFDIGLTSELRSRYPILSEACLGRLVCSCGEPRRTILNQLVHLFDTHQETPAQIIQRLREDGL